MRGQNAKERVHQRLKEWQRQHGRGANKLLASAIPGDFGKPMSEQWASGVLRKGDGLHLEHLDYYAELLGIPPGDLVRRDGDHYLEVIPSEMRFLKHIRSLPDTVRQHWLAFLDYIFGFQHALLTERKAKVDKRTKLARLERARQRQRPGA